MTLVFASERARGGREGEGGGGVGTEVGEFVRARWSIMGRASGDRVCIRYIYAHALHLAPTRTYGTRTLAHLRPPRSESVLSSICASPSAPNPPPLSLLLSPPVCLPPSRLHTNSKHAHLRAGGHEPFAGRCRRPAASSATMPKSHELPRQAISTRMRHDRVRH